MKNANKILKAKPLILDGATGTELYKRGMPHGVCPEIWCVDNPDTVQEVHADYADAGSDIVYTCTFGANTYKLNQYGESNVYGINKKLARLARKAVGPAVLVAGDIGPTGKSIHNLKSVDFETRVKEFKAQVKGLRDGGVDLFVIETMMDIQEARAALIAAKEEAPKKFVIVTMTYELDGHTLGGTDPVSALVTLQSLGADMVGCNCSTGPQNMLKIIKAMQPFATVPLVAKPNAGMPRLVKNKTVFDMDAITFAQLAAKFIPYGVGAIGGCCGTTPGHIAQLKKKLKGVKRIKPKNTSISAISSARKTVIFGKEKKPTIIGECINPTGKKALAEDLRQGKFSVARALAKEQEQSNASVLDVNVGASGVDEAAAMEGVLQTLTPATSLPLCIDSSNPAVIEKALRLYPGRALINSISAEKEKLKQLLHLTSKYGAMFILLPISGKTIPKTAAERKKIITQILKEAKKFDVAKDDILVDGLVLTVSSQPKSAKETIKTIELCSKRLKLKTTVGLSNVSFGLPQRKILNNSFLVMLTQKGLTAAIADPAQLNYKKDKLACNVLLAKDKDAKKYVAYYSKYKPQRKKEVVKKISPKEQIRKSIIEGNREDIEAIITQALSTKIKANDLINNVMIPAITEVGELFDKKQYFLPQLIASAETMKKGFEKLKPLLKQKDAVKNKLVVFLATVEGDIHDIGKNIVALMLENYGFRVLDLGKDVSAERIIREIKKYKPAVVGLSALMTTTMVNMKEVISLAKQNNLRCKFMVGGAVITKSYAHSIGAEYAKDGVEAVRILTKLSRKG